MSRTFLAFNDDVIKTGIVAAQPGLAELLGRTTRRFLELASKISPDSDEESQSEAAHLDTLATGDRSSLRDYASLGSGMVDHHTVTTPNGLNASSPGQSSCARPVHLQAATKSPKTMDFDLEKHFSVSSRNPSVENVRSGFTSFPLIQEPSTQGQGTYSFQETTFSRRLHRRCLELGYTFLNDHSLTTHHISSKFRFTFGFLTRERLARVFYTLLQSKAGEPLEYWHKPFFYVGRAGMHYPRRDESGYEIFPPNMHPPERAFGPFPFHAAENPHPYKNVNEMIEAIGYGGDWFDCHDVEGYLLEKGIRLYSRSSYVLVSRSALSRSVHAGQVPNLATYSTTGSHPGSHGSTASVTPSPQNTHFDSPSLMAQLPSDTYYPPQDDFGPEMSRLQGLDQNPSLSLGSGPALPNMASPWHPQQPTVESLPHLTLDVDKFVVGELLPFLCS